MEKIETLREKSQNLLNGLLYATTEDEYKSIETDLKDTNRKIAVLEGQDRVRDKAAEEAAMKARIKAQSTRLAQVKETNKQLADIEHRLFDAIKDLFALWTAGMDLIKEVAPTLADAEDEARELGHPRPGGIKTLFAYKNPFGIVGDIESMFQQYASQAGTLESAKKQGKAVKMLVPDWNTFTEFGTFRVDDDGNPIHY